METINKIEEYNLLRELSYLKLESDSYINQYGNIYNNNNIIDFIKKNKKVITDIDSTHKVNFIGDTSNNTEGILDKYEIIDFFNDSVSGTQMMLYKNKLTNEHVISYRGTEFGTRDLWITDIRQMGLKLGINGRFIKSLNQTKEWFENSEYGLTLENTTLSGHSLGGALAQLNSYVYGFPAYTINAFGFEAGVGSINNFLIDLIYDPVKNENNVYNFIHQSGFIKDIVSGELTDIVGDSIIDIISNNRSNTHLGETIIIKDYTGGYEGLIGDHSSITINDSISIYHDLMKTFNIEENINGYHKLTKIIDKYEVDTTTSQFKYFLNDISDILGIDKTKLRLDISDEISNFQNLTLNTNYLENENLNSIINKNDNLSMFFKTRSEEINFVIEGSSFDFYENMNFSHISEEQNIDLSHSMFYKLNPESNSNTTYENLETNSIVFGKNDQGYNKVVFGKNENISENIIVNNGNDKVYGNGGNDTIITYGGDDYIEGGSGNDIISVTRGNNTIYGDEGNDIITSQKGYNSLTGGNDSDIFKVGYQNSLSVIEDLESIDKIEFRNKFTQEETLLFILDNDNLAIRLSKDSYVEIKNGMNFENDSTKLFEFSSGEKYSLLE